MGKTNLGRVTFVPRGTYSNETAYRRLDVVEYEGNSFVFLKDSTGVVPTGDNVVTMFLAKKGKDFAYEDFTSEQLAALKGEKGDKGDPGKGLTILGYYGTLDLLKVAVTTPEPGDTYGIGTAAPYDIYLFDGVTNDWVNNGKLSGGGEGGGNSVVFIPSAVLNLTNESPSAEILTAFGGKDAFISIVTQLEKGILPMINIEGVFFQFSLFAAYHDAENNTYTLGFRLADAEVLKINGYEGTNGLVAIVLTNDTASVEIMDIPGNGLNYIAIPGNVLNIDEGSTSEQIIAKFGGMDNIRSIIRNSESGGNSLYVLTADNARVPIMGTLYNFNGDYDSPSFEITLDILYLITKRVLTLRFNKGVAAVEYRYEGSLIADSELVSDPSVGGTDKPASAEAVKTVNDEIETIQSNMLILKSGSYNFDGWVRIADGVRMELSSCLLSIGTPFIDQNSGGCVISLMAHNATANATITNKIGVCSGVDKIRYVFSKSGLSGNTYLDIRINKHYFSMISSLTTGFVFRKIADWERVSTEIPSNYNSVELDITW